MHRPLRALGARDEAHAPAAAARRGLQQHREPELGCGDSNLCEARDPFGAGDERNPGRPHLGLRSRLVPRLLHHVRRRPDEDEIAALAGPHERRVLGQEAVARVHCLAPGRLGRCDHVRNAEVAVGRRRRPDAHRSVGHANVQRVVLRGRVDRHRLHTQLVQRPDHPDGDLTPVRDEDAGEHDR